MKESYSPLISVIIPCYNVEKYITECLKSVIEQSYKNLEIIIVNDGSTDDTEREIEPFLQDTRIKYITKKNQGASGARNTGLDHMNGQYVCFIDSDDIVHKDFISNLYNDLVETNSDVAICDLHKFNDNEIPHIIEGEKERNVFSRDEIMKELLFNWIIIIPCCKIFKKELFDDLRFSLGKYYEDELISHHIFWKTNKVVISNLKLYLYRQWQGSTMNTYNEAKFSHLIEAFDNRIGFYKKHSIPNIELIYGKKWNIIVISIIKFNHKLAKKHLFSNLSEFMIHYIFRYIILKKLFFWNKHK